MTEARQNLEVLAKTLSVEKTQDFIQFRTTFVNNYDFDRVREMAQSQQIKRTGSRSTCWKLMLGVLPLENDKAKWHSRLLEERNRYTDLKNKYFTLHKYINTVNPLAALSNKNKKQGDDPIFSSHADKDLRSLIRKDVERTLQDQPFFKDENVLIQMEEILFVWAKEHPDFKYQQGMNEILGVVIVCLASELVSKADKKQESDETDDSCGNDTASIFQDVHDSQYLWADSYALFERIMNLGIKELYYRDETSTQDKEDDVTTPSTGTFSNTLKPENISSQFQLSPASKKSESNASIDKSNAQRIKKQKLLQLQQEDSDKTALRKRANKIFNNYLKELDFELYSHIQELQVQPELILLKWLRCMLSREFNLNNLLSIWDYIFSGIQEDGRFMLQQYKDQNDEIYQDDNYFISHSDSLINLDYVCLAMIQYQRSNLIDCDYIDCLKVMMNYPKLSGSNDIMKIADRIQKVLFEKQVKSQKQVLETQHFPVIVEQETANYHAQSHESDSSLQRYNSDSPANSDKPKKFFQVNEEASEEEDEDFQLTDLDYKMSRVNRVQGPLSEPCEGNEETEERFHECDDETQERESEALPKQESDAFHDCNEEQQDQVDESTQQSNNIFKIKNTKGSVVYDKQTKQKRFMSPFDKFLAEQQELFKKNIQNQDQHDEQNSVTMTTTASTQFDQKTVILPLQVGFNSSSSGSVHEDAQTPHKRSQTATNLQSHNLLHLAKTMIVGTKIKTAEDKMIEERMENRKQLKAIKNYLCGIKTGDRIKVSQVKRSTKTQVESKMRLF